MMPRILVVVVAAGVLASCAGVRVRGTNRAPLHQELSTVSSGCLKNPAGCSAMHGLALETGAIVGAAAAVAVGTTVAVQELVEVGTRAKVDEVLKECADLARSEVLIRDLGGRSPTVEECNEIVRTPAGERIPRYLWFGNEMHRIATSCVNERLGKVLPGQFSLEQRYRYDLRTGTATVVTAAEEAAIMRDQRFEELRGTLVPDVVIHNGNPRFIGAVYDFKFPCADVEKWQWRYYESGPFQGFNQEEIYEAAFGQPPAVVVPRLGVLR